MSERVTFSFGQNWERYLDQLHPRATEAMASYFQDWLPDTIAGRSFVDVGSGSGLSSLIAFQRGAVVTSFDVDPHSVAATERLWRSAERPTTWRVLYGSVLDPAFVAGLGSFDIVLSWGVLHHTGALWDALDAAAALPGPHGLLWIALYTRTARSRQSLRIKRAYNRTPGALKVLFRGAYGIGKIAKHLVVFRTLDRLRNYHNERGMDWRRDVEDWLGGLPYEVSAPEEVIAHLEDRFELLRLQRATGEGGNDVYLFKRRADTKP